MTFPKSIPADAEVLGAPYCVAVVYVDPVPLLIDPAGSARPAGVQTRTLVLGPLFGQSLPVERPDALEAACGSQVKYQHSAIGVNSRRDTSRPIYLNITAARQKYVADSLISALGMP